MGQFAGAVFTGLLSWVRTAVSDLWRLMGGAQETTLLRWLLDHWLLLTLLLCAGGLLIDFIVYLIRWQPYRVWRSARSSKREARASEEEEEQLYQRRWQYADGTTTVEDVRRRAEEAPLEISQHLQAPVQTGRRLPRRATREQSYNQPVYPPQWHKPTDASQGGIK